MVASLSVVVIHTATLLYFPRMLTTAPTTKSPYESSNPSPIRSSTWIESSHQNIEQANGCKSSYCFKPISVNVGFFVEILFVYCDDPSASVLIARIFPCRLNCLLEQRVVGASRQVVGWLNVIEQPETTPTLGPCHWANSTSYKGWKWVLWT